MKKIKEYTFQEILIIMKKDSTRNFTKKSWSLCDYIFIGKDGILYCDGGVEYFSKLTTRDINGKWIEALPWSN